MTAPHTSGCGCRRCPARQSKTSAHLLGFSWTCANELVFFTNQGIELYQVNAERRSVKCLRTVNVNTNWHIYSVGQLHGAVPRRISSPKPAHSHSPCVPCSTRAGCVSCHLLHMPTCCIRSTSEYESAGRHCWNEPTHALWTTARPIPLPASCACICCCLLPPPTKTPTPPPYHSSPHMPSPCTRLPSRLVP